MPTGRTTTHRKITSMEEMTDSEWLKTLSFACLCVGEFSVSVATTINYTPENLQEAEQALRDAQEGQALAENGFRIVEALRNGKVTARSHEAYEMLAVMLDITEWHYSYATRHVTPSEDLLIGYAIAKSVIEATANA